MPQGAAPAVVCEQALEYEYRDGLFYVTDPTLAHRKVLRPHLMRESIAKAARCYAEFRSATGAEVIPFKARG